MTISPTAQLTRRPLRFPESVLDIRGLAHRLSPAVSHPIRGEYVETFWLPILGPSALVLARRLNLELARHPQGLRIESDLLARQLGLGMKGGQHGPFWRTVDRLHRFGVVHRSGAVLEVRAQLATLSAKQLDRLPRGLQVEHAAFVLGSVEDA